MNPSFYSYLQFKMSEHSNKGNLEEYRALEILSAYHIPKKIRKVILKEMEDMNMIIIKQPMIRIINSKINVQYELYQNYTRLTKSRIYVEEISK